MGGVAAAAGPRSDAVGLDLEAGAAIFSEFRRARSRQRQAVIVANSELRGPRACQAGRLGQLHRCRAACRGWACRGDPGRRDRHDAAPRAVARWASEEDGQDLTDIMRGAMTDVRELIAED